MKFFIKRPIENLKLNLSETVDKEVQGIFSSKKGLTKVIATLEKDSYYS